MKNKLLYLLTIIITLFTFNMNVNAAQELTCIYGAEWRNERLILTQDSYGNRLVYTNDEKEAKLNDEGWNLRNYTININEVYDKFKDESGDLISCPEYATQIGLNNTTAYFGSDYNTLYNKGAFNDVPNKLETPSYNTLEKIGPKLEEGVAKELTCVYKYDSANERKIILHQYSTGEKQIYINNANLKIDGGGWEKQNQPNILFSKDNLKDMASLEGAVEDKILQECPISAYTSKNSDDKKIYFGFGLGMYIELEYSEEKIILPAKIEVTSNSSNDNGKSCSEKDNFEITKFENSPYITSCIYARDINESCHIIQINVDKNRNMFIEQSRVGGANDKFLPNYSTLNIGIIEKNLNGWCPNMVYVSIKKDILAGNDTVKLSLKQDENNYLLYQKVAGKGVNLVDKAKEQTDELIEDISNSSLIGDLKKNIECSDLFEGDYGEKLKKLLKTFVNIIKIAIPILLIGLGIVDFAKNIFSGKEDDMKKMQAKFIKRIIIGVCIFLTPSLIKFILTIASGIWGNISSDFCGIL